MTKTAECEFVAGHVFFSPGDHGDQAYLVDEGHVELLAGTSESFVRIGLFQAGDVFGEMALIEERPRAFTARAVTTGRISPITRDEFEQLLMHDPARTRMYLRSLFERLRSLSDKIGTEVERDQNVAEPLAGPVDMPMLAGSSSEWTAIIHPLTHKAAQTLPELGLLVTRFPLRIGRAAAAKERDGLDLNDVWLLDDAPHHVSRNHCELTIDSNGPLIRDRGSKLGCFVNDKPIGGSDPFHIAHLDIGDNVLVVGGRMSPYQFRISLSHA